MAAHGPIVHRAADSSLDPAQQIPLDSKIHFHTLLGEGLEAGDERPPLRF